MGIDDLVQSGHLLVGLDFDGTLAPIAPTAERAQILPEAAWALEMLRRMPRTEVAILSGRDLPDLASKIPNHEDFWLAGSHGRSVRRPGEGVRASGFDDRLLAYRDLEMLPGIRKEIKEFSVAYHWRGRTGGEPTGWVEQRKASAKRDGLEVLEGRMVLEILLPGEGKETALMRIFEETGATAVFFAGDDRTDLESIRIANERGLGLFVYSAERSALAPEGIETLDGPDELAQWLGKLAFQRICHLRQEDPDGLIPLGDPAVLGGPSDPPR